MASLLDTLKKDSKLKTSLEESKKADSPKKKSDQIESDDIYDFAFQQIKRDNPDLFRKIMRLD